MMKKLLLSTNLMFKSVTVATSITVLAPVTMVMATSPVAAQAWQSNKAYVAGDLVTYQSKTYKAKWWSYGSIPSSSDAWQLVNTAPVDTQAPTTPSALTNTAKTANSITLTWGASTDNVSVTGYNIYRNNVKVGTTASLTYTDSNLQPSTTYAYTVKAVDGANNESAGAALSAQTTASESPGPVLNVGQSRVLTIGQINTSWQGINEQYSPDKATQAVTSILPRAEYESLFPRRAGTPAWHAIAQNQDYYRAELSDYYSYDNFIAAVRDTANIKYKEVYRTGSPLVRELYRLDKTTKTETLIHRSADFNAPGEINKPLITRIVDFGTFLKEGVEKDRKREFAAFIANIAHETGGGWPTAPDGELRWGLFFNEERSYVNSGSIGYIAPEYTDYAPVAGKSYHGRGPIQLSWNYNYGLFSSIIYGDKNVLLNDPDRIADDGRLGFMTAMLFWMTPQDPKPSAHDVIVGNYVPTAAQLSKGLVPGFGTTIMVINGGQEGNLDETDNRIRRRVAHYTELAAKANIDITGEKLNTLGMQQF
ncbi:glycoside hydrolase family 19 protein [Paenibacillus sp. FJAT-26967]|uniref:glycoside hydrolase family 19 protein n=1 Tax=Paenibacillus sp. FJAT-26967 TaxID=1729690 RepID=UPI0008384766|nr:glycoside hydrolase family 19 protein [Paenibacillus sp. FJAT-26967]